MFYQTSTTSTHLPCCSGTCQCCMLPIVSTNSHHVGIHTVIDLESKNWNQHLFCLNEKSRTFFHIVIFITISMGRANLAKSFKMILKNRNKEPFKSPFFNFLLLFKIKLFSVTHVYCSCTVFDNLSLKDSRSIIRYYW